MLFKLWNLATLKYVVLSVSQTGDGQTQSSKYLSSCLAADVSRQLRGEYWGHESVVTFPAVFLGLGLHKR